MAQALNKTTPSYQVDKQQFLEFIAQKAATSPEKLQIQLGQRQIFGQTSEGLFVDELNNGRLQVLIETLQHRSVDKVDNQRYSEQNPEIEIKSEDKILFRQETDGVVSNNNIIPSSQVESQNEQSKSSSSYSTESIVYLTKSEDIDRKLNATERDHLRNTVGDFEALFEKNKHLSPINKNNKYGEFELSYNCEQQDLTVRKNNILLLQVKEGNIYAVNKNSLVENTKSISELLKFNQNEVQPAENNLNTNIVSSQAPETLVGIDLDQSNIAEKEVDKLPNNKTKQFIKTLLKELGQKTQQAVQGVTSLIQLKRDREVASTAIQLLDRHYAKTQEHTYHADGYKISLEDDDIYVVSGRADRKLMKIKTGGLTGPKILENQMNKFHYQDFDRARKQIQTLGIEGLSNQPHKRVIQLGNLAPQADSQIVNLIKTQQVKQIAVNFLNATGVRSWDAGDKGSYSIDSIDDNNLEIRSTKDERGIILKLSNGRLESNLEAKDFAYFNQLKNYTPVVNKSSHAVVKPPIVNDLASSNLRNLAALIAAKNVLDAFNLESYESESFQFEKQNNTLVVKAKDGRGEIARLQNGQVMGKVSERDVIHFSSLNQAIQLTSEPSSSLIDLAASKQTKGNLTPSESSYTKLAGGIEME